MKAAIRFHYCTYVHVLEMVGALCAVCVHVCGVVLCRLMKQYYAGELVDNELPVFPEMG